MLHVNFTACTYDETLCIISSMLQSLAVNGTLLLLLQRVHICGLQAFRGIWRMKEGQQGEQSSRLSYSLFVRPQVRAYPDASKAGQICIHELLQEHVQI